MCYFLRIFLLFWKFHSSVISLNHGARTLELFVSKEDEEPLFYNIKIIWKNEYAFSLNVELCTFGVNFKGELWIDEY
jgi:hypothetical protein